MKKLGDSYSLNGKEFFRKCVCIPNNVFSFNFSKYRPSLNEVITFIHENGGILFLAHPYAYKMKNTEEFLDNLYDEYKDIDGIECYYYDFTKEQIDYIKDFSEKRNLMISGGSDFHGNPGRKNQMGICINHDGFIPKEILDLIDKRRIARENKEWNKSDELRDLINQKGYDIKDTKQGTEIKKR